MGYRDVAHLEIGYDAWKKAGGAWTEVPIPDELLKD
jgi:rhodanese-related sulfurtransferase